MKGHKTEAPFSLGRLLERRGILFVMRFAPSNLPAETFRRVAFAFARSVLLKRVPPLSSVQIHRDTTRPRLSRALLFSMGPPNPGYFIESSRATPGAKFPRRSPRARLIAVST